MLIFFTISVWAYIIYDQQQNLQNETNIISEQSAVDFKNEVLYRIDIFKTMEQQWIEMNNNTGSINYSQFKDMAIQYYGIYDSLSIISWINDSADLQYLYPENINDSLINEYIISNINENWNKYFNQANETPNITISILKNIPNNEYFIIYYPVINNENITGYFGLIFNVNILVQTIISQSPIYNDYDYALYENGTLLNESNNIIANFQKFAVQKTISIYNNNWTLIICPNEQVIKSISPINQWTILIFGGLTTIVAALWINSEYKNNEVKLKTYELEREIERKSFQSKKIESLATLTGAIVHDYNNILMEIEGGISLLKQYFNDNLDIKTNHLDQEATIFFRLIEEGIEEASNYNRQISEFSNCSEFSLKRVELNNIIRETIAIFLKNEEIENNKGSNKKRIKILPTFGENLVYIMGNKLRLEQLFTNIFINSRDAIVDEGTITIDISIIPREKITEPGEDYDRQRELLIRIADNSSEISEEDIDKLFDPFFITKKEIKKRGHGLELAISYQIVNHMKGFMELSAFKNNGIEISIHLPLLREKISFEETEKIIRTNNTTQLQNELKVLIIDDEPLIGKAIKKYFEHNNIHTDYYENGFTGLKAYKSNNEDYFVIILDMNLPDFNGIEIYKEIRKIDKNQLILFMTGYSESEIPQNDDKIINVLLKPFGFKEFDSVVDEIKKKMDFDE